MVHRATAINPQVLRWARERAGYSVAAVAGKLNKPAAVVASWEDGTDAPTFRQLEALANRYKRPVALFFFPQPPLEEDARTQFRTLPDTEIEALEPDTRYALREAMAFRESLEELTGGSTLAERLITRDIQADAGETVEALADRVRSYLGISLNVQSGWPTAVEAFKEWRTAVEAAGVFVFKRSFKQKDISGFCLEDPALPLIMINNSTAHSRQTFTLFHELAHLLYRVSGITKEDTRYINRLVGRDREIEVACNRFASEFLVPGRTFPWGMINVQDLDNSVERVARRYNVSREVILRRLLDRELVDEATYLRKAAEWHQQYRESRENGSGGNYYATHATYLGDAFLRLAFSQYHSGRVSLDELADHLRMKASNVPHLQDFIMEVSQL